MDDLYISRVYRPDNRPNIGMVFSITAKNSDGLPYKSTSSADQIAFQKSYELNKWKQKLGQMDKLEQGWDGYTAEPPSHFAIVTAEGFLTHLQAVHREPSRLVPSVEGGVGITHKNSKRRVFVEFFNDGEVYALFSDGETEPVSKRVPVGFAEFRQLTEEIKDYLNA